MIRRVIEKHRTSYFIDAQNFFFFFFIPSKRKLVNYTFFNVTKNFFEVLFFRVDGKVFSTFIVIDIQDFTNLLSL